jgi:hypothetical protein
VTTSNSIAAADLVCTMILSAIFAHGRSPIENVSIEVILLLVAKTPNSNAIESEDKTESQKLQNKFLLAVHMVVNPFYASTSCLSSVHFSRLVFEVSDSTIVSE